jgi:hypothetical protein
MAIKRSSQVGTPFGTTANRPASPAVGQTYYNGTLGYLEIYTASGWTAAAKAIPFGNTAARPANPVIGEPYFNGQEARLELYTSNGWQNIVQETPAVVSIVGQLNETTTSTLTLNGTNFAVGAIAYVVGTSGVETVATTTTFISVAELSAVFPALAVADAPYDVKVVNPSNLYGVLYETLGVNDKPVWSTTAGSLGTFTEVDAVSITVAATDATDSTNSALQYTLVSGSLPTGLSLNSSTGVISGTPANVVSSTTYSFTLGASDSRNTVQNRAFSITISDRSPVWTTSSVLPIFTRNVAYSTTVAATDDDSGAITYSLASGSLPTGLSLSSAGVISGTPTSSTNASFTIRATVTASGTTADRAFTMANNGPTWVTTTSNFSNPKSGISYNFTLQANDDSGSNPSYSISSGTLPTGLSLNSSTGVISGTTSDTTSRSVTFLATDANSTSSSLTITNMRATVIQTTTITSSQTFTPQTSVLDSVLIVGGGGGGGSTNSYSAGGSGGGGGGFVRALTNVAVTPGQVYNIVIGAGAPRSNLSTGSGSRARDGGKSSAFGYEAFGGQGGMNGGNGADRAASERGPGGGSASYGFGYSQANQIVDQGFAGNTFEGNSSGGGGGSTTSGNGTSTAGNPGYTWSVNGQVYGGGGGGGGSSAGSGGSGGGGQGTNSSSGGNATSYGGGGGGISSAAATSAEGGSGFQGIVIINAYA